VIDWQPYCWLLDHCRAQLFENPGRIACRLCHVCSAADNTLRFALGPTVERLIDFTNNNRRALNLASGEYITDTAEKPLDFGPAGADTLREAGVDLYLSDAAVETIKGAARLNENEGPLLNTWIGASSAYFLLRKARDR